MKKTRVTHSMEGKLIFESLDIHHRSEYERYLSDSGIVSSQYSFLALWAWRDAERTEICFDGHYPVCWLKNRKGLLAPICRSGLDWGKIVAEKFPNGVIFNDVPEQLKIDGGISEELRSEWEYVHLVSDLAELKGKNFHQKRTHVKNFERKYRSVYAPILEDDFDEIKIFQGEWLAKQQPRAALDEENDAIARILECWSDFPLFGATVKVEGKIAAYTIAEELAPDTLDIRFEKALSEYEGLYQALNRDFLARQGKSYKWVNREEDMGIGNMRKAKMSYFPIRFVKKWRIKI